MYTANFVTNRIQKQRVIASIRLSLRSYIPIPIPGNCFLDKNSISKQNTGKANYKHQGNSLFTTIHLI